MGKCRQSISAITDCGDKSWRRGSTTLTQCEGPSMCFFLGQLRVNQNIPQKLTARYSRLNTNSKSATFLLYIVQWRSITLTTSEQPAHEKERSDLSVERTPEIRQYKYKTRKPTAEVRSHHFVPAIEVMMWMASQLKLCRDL